MSLERLTLNLCVRSFSLFSRRLGETKSSEGDTSVGGQRNNCSSVGGGERGSEGVVWSKI